MLSLRNVGKALGQKNDTRPFAGLSMVDVGCGGGLLAEVGFCVRV